MLPVEPNLELHSRLPARANSNGRKPPLLFVHGGYIDAWCWLPHFLPWFANQGYAAHALSLGATLATSSLKSLRRISGLSVENWVR